MLTRLGYYTDKAVEAGWLAAAVFIPLFFNVYSSRVFEPDKISLLRSLVLLMTIAWLIKLFESGFRAGQESDAPTRAGRLSAAAQGIVNTGTPSWLGFLRVPMIVPILTYALVYLVSSIFTMTPDATWWGSYQRLQGTYSQYSYIMLGILVIANMRSRVQLERLLSFMILTSIPVALYGLLQANRLDPLPWAGDTATRVASTMGNAIFVAAWLIMAVPYTLYRLMNGISAMLATREAESEESEVGVRRPVRRLRVNEGPDLSWAVIANATALILSEMFVFVLALNLVAGLPFPDAALWWAVPMAITIFYFGCWGLEWLGNHRDDPRQSRVILPITGVGLFLTAMLAFVFKWDINRDTVTAIVKFDGAGLLWVFFFVAAWATVMGVAYFFREPEGEPRDPDKGLIRAALNSGYGILIVIQLFCIYLTQSRGPWLGIGAGLVAFAVALWLVGRRNKVQWMYRLGGSASAIVLVIALFVGALNIPGSPLQSLDKLPGIGVGIERLSTLTRTEDGTGKVRTLIWQGAADLITSNPLRTIIGYGPESMYVVYNKFYPPELAHWELRNATPDRSHNVEFDHLVTMGVVGLAAYYFILAAFFWYCVRILKRARNTRDQLFGITLISVITSHFVETQTGIQIAATWTYFYMTIGAMVVFGYYITNYLRRGAATEVATEGDAPLDTSMEDEYAPDRSGARSAEARQPVTAVSSSYARTTRPAVAAPGGDGKGGPVSTKARGAQAAGREGRGNGRSGNGNVSTQPGSRGQMSEAKRRQAQIQARAAQQRLSVGTEFSRNPAMILLYVGAFLAGLLFIWVVNVATVQADTLYKQGQSYDGAQQYQNSIDKYNTAIALQPNQDYYYLFRGRAYLESAKQAGQVLQNGKNPNTGKDLTADERTQVRNQQITMLQRAEGDLVRARDLNPLNTDHYANLGRLYLYWSDPAGGNDPSRANLTTSNFEEATQKSPGNAQIWDELAVAYARNGSFDKAIQTLQHSETVDNTYARTPFIEGQLHLERANGVKNALQAKTALPTGGETDYGKLVIQAGRAFSRSISMDAAYFVDNGMPDSDSGPGFVTQFLEAGKPFTGTNSTIDPVTLSNVLTDTIVAAYNQLMAPREKAVANVLRSHNAYTGAEDKVPQSVLDPLWQRNDWAGVRPGGATREWLPDDMHAAAAQAVVPYAALGYMRFRLNDIAGSTANYRRAVELDPSNYFNQKNLGSLLVEEGQKDEGLSHLKAALNIVESQPDLNTDAQKQKDLQQIQSDIQQIEAPK